MLPTCVFHSPSPETRVITSQLPPSRLGLPVAAKVMGFHGLNLLSYHRKDAGINIHEAVIDQWEIDTEQYTLLPGHAA